MGDICNMMGEAYARSNMMDEAYARSNTGTTVATGSRLRPLLQQQQQQQQPRLLCTAAAATGAHDAHHNLWQPPLVFESPL
jgi:hypothetical protein